MHVRDLDAVDHAHGGPDRESRAWLVRVDVHLQGGGVADDQQGVAQLVQLGLDRLGVELLPFDEESGAVAVARELLVDRVDRRLPGFHRRLGKPLARDPGRDPADDLQESRTAGVDDPGLAEDVELLGCSRDRLLAPADELGEESVDAETVAGARLRLLCELADDREHRSLDWLANRAVGGVGSRAEGAGQHLFVDLALLGAERLGGAADDLGEDHARVAASAHQRRPRHLAHDRGTVGRGRAGEVLDDRPARERQVRARVPVGDGVDVEIVDPAAAALERLERDAGDLADGVEVAHALGLDHGPGLQGYAISRSLNAALTAR